MTDIEAPAAEQTGIQFSITVEAQEIRVRYHSAYWKAADYALFEFLSPHEPRRRIPVSETGYRAHHSPMRQIREAPNVEAYAYALVRELMNRRQDDEEATDDAQQLALF